MWIFWSWTACCGVETQNRVGKKESVIVLDLILPIPRLILNYNFNLYVRNLVTESMPLVVKDHRRKDLLEWASQLRGSGKACGPGAEQGYIPYYSHSLDSWALSVSSWIYLERDGMGRHWVPVHAICPNQ
jgi:hypothetical protein